MLPASGDFPSPARRRGVAAKPGERPRGAGRHALHAVRGRGAEQAALRLHRAPRTHRAVREPGRPAPRSLRCLRLRSRLPVRAHPAGPIPSRRPARSRPLPARRDRSSWTIGASGRCASVTSSRSRDARRVTFPAWAPPSPTGAPRASSARATTRPASMQKVCGAPARASGAATSSRWFRARCSSSHARPRPPRYSVGLRERNPAPYGFLINLGRGRIPGGRIARDVRARGGRPRRDLPDLRHRGARAGPARRRRSDSRSF